MKTEIEEILLKKGLKSYNLGYGYTRLAVELLFYDDSLIHRLTTPNGLYEKIANAYNTTGRKVERSIRHSKPVKYELYPGSDWEKIAVKYTNAEFLMDCLFELRKET